jgi:hypothetical protein
MTLSAITRSEESEMKLFRDTETVGETFIQMMWNKKLPWYENLAIWAVCIFIWFFFYAMLFFVMLLGE